MLSVPERNTKWTSWGLGSAWKRWGNRVCSEQRSICFSVKLLPGFWWHEVMQRCTQVVFDSIHRSQDLTSFVSVYLSSYSLGMLSPCGQTFGQSRWYKSGTIRKVTFEFSGCYGFSGEKWRSIRSEGAGGGGCDCARGGRWEWLQRLQCLSCISPWLVHISQEGFHFVEKQLNQTKKQPFCCNYSSCISYLQLRCISKLSWSQHCQDDPDFSVMKNTIILKMAVANMEYYIDIKIFRICWRGSSS